MSQWKRTLVAVVAAACVAAPAAAVVLVPAPTALVTFTALGVADTPELERALVRQAPTVIKQLKGKGYNNVGVLKFLAVKNGAEITDNIGTLNLILAQRLEVALVLANDPRQPLGIVSGASAVAQKTPGANHRSPQGRLKLFEPQYPLAWGRKTVPVDAFVTGLVKVADDLKTMTISLLVFDKEENKLSKLVDDFPAANRPDHLAEMGESFVLRGAFDNAEGTPAVKEKEKQEKALETAYEVKKGGAPNPAKDKGAPVTLEIRYDGKPVRLQHRNGKCFAPEPYEGQKVEFVVKRDNSKNRYGVVLKVNGENTIRKQRLPDLACRRWIMDASEKPLIVRGYQIDDYTRENFRVLSAYKSKAREVYYGAEVGTVTLTVFKEKQGKQPPFDLSDEYADSTAVAKAKFPDEASANWSALKATLLEEANRGLIAEGEKVAGRIRKVKFDPDPTPVMSLTVIYYQKR